MGGTARPSSAAPGRSGAAASAAQHPAAGTGTGPPPDPAPSSRSARHCVLHRPCTPVKVTDTNPAAPHEAATWATAGRPPDLSAAIVASLVPAGCGVRRGWGRLAGLGLLDGVVQR